MNANPGDELSDREIEILRLVATGATNLQVARTLFISPNTVKTHLRNIFAKLDVESRTEATLYAVQVGLIDVGGGALAAPVPAVPDAAESPLVKMFHASRLALSNRGARGAVLGLSLALAIALVLWPSARGRVSLDSTPDRFIDTPSTVSAGPQATGASRWSDRSPMISPVGRFALSTVLGKVYIIGGVGQSGVTGAVQVYQPEADVWESGPAKPTPVSNVGAANVDGLIYVPGGVDAEGRTLDILEILDPVSGEWHAGPALPASLCSYAIASDATGFYLFGGWDGARYVDTVLKYDVSARSWSQVGALSSARGFAAATTIGDRIYLVGGYDGETELGTCESFDPAAGQGEEPWRKLADLPEGRAGHAVTPALGHLYVLGGGWQMPFTANARYDVANDAWGNVATPITGEWRTLGATTVDTSSGLYVYAFGGWHGSYLADVQAYQAFYRLYLP
ncbi:MAG: Kelch repeat-containing protein [Anaerolineae bacterium]